MARKDRFRARDKLTHKMTRDGLVEVNETTGEQRRVSQRGQEYNIQDQRKTAQNSAAQPLESNRAHVSESGRKHYRHIYESPQPQAAVTSPQVGEMFDHNEPGQHHSETSSQVGKMFETDAALNNYALPDEYVQRRQSTVKGNDIPVRNHAAASHAATESVKPTKNKSTDPQLAQPADTTGRLRIDAAEHSGKQEARGQRKQPADSGKSGSQPAEAEAAKTGKLQFAPDDLPPGPVGGKLTKARRNAERADAKLDRAREKLPVKRKIIINRELNPETGGVIRRLQFERDPGGNLPIKSQRDHIKGPLPLRPAKLAANAAIGYAHKKMYQVEHENVAVKAAHRSELAVESVARTALRLHKTRPYRRVARLERGAAKARIELSYRQALNDNPKLGSNPFSRYIQKRRIKRQYAKAARNAQKTAKNAGRTGNFLKDTAKAVAEYIKRHPKTAIVIAMLALLIVFLMASAASCSNLMGTGFPSIFLSSYVAEDADIDNAELVYTEWETDLQLEIASAETDYPDYDEYRYQVDDIGHNPFELMAFLTAVYMDFEFSYIEGVLREIFDEQYSLEFIPEIETRYADPEDENGDGDYEPYEWKILNISLEAKSFLDVITPRMDADQLEMFELYMETMGNRQYIMNPFDFDWIPYISSYYGWRVHPITGEKDYHKGIDIAVPVGTDILAGHDGRVTFAGYSGDYGYIVAVEGENNLISKYAHCDSVLVSVGQEVKKGDVIAKSGNSGASTGPHLHLEVIKDGLHLNPLYFAETLNSGSSCLPGTPGGPVIPDYPGSPMTDESFAALMEEAQKHLGKRYQFGAAGPDTFDCSGFVSYVFANSLYPGLERMTAYGLYGISTPISPENAKPGDLVFFHSTYSTTSPTSHIAIYIGDGWVIHAGDPVKYENINTSYWQEHLYGYARLV